MVTEIRKTTSDEYRLYIWRDSEEKDKGLEVRITSDKGKPALKQLQNKLESLKFYPAIKAISSLKSYKMQWRDGIHEWEDGLPNFVGKNIETPEFLKYDSNKAHTSSKREKKEPPSWIRYISEETKKLKAKEDANENLLFSAYSKEIFEGYAKAKVRYYTEYPTYKPPSWENPGIISSMLTKGIIWGTIRKYKAIMEASKSPYDIEVAGQKFRMSIGRLKANEDLAVKALRNAGASDDLIKQEKNEVDKGPDEYITTQSQETLNNKLFMDMDADKREAIMKAVGFSDKDIQKRMAAISDKSDAGSTVKPKFHSFKDILESSKEK
jgi:hypothetical protein